MSSKKSVDIKCNNDIGDHDIDGQEPKFIFFGCWNNINCEKEYIYRDIVLDYIKNNESDIKQLYIAGDNWYTNKKTIDEKELKLYITDILRTGYEKLYSMDKDIYIAVGNHDIDSDIEVISETSKSSTSVRSPRAAVVETTTKSLNDPNKFRNELIDIALKENCNINTQKYYLKQIKEGIDFDAPTLEKLQELKDTKLSEASLCKNGIYIYVDDIGVRYNKNYIIIIINTNNFDNFANGLKYLDDIKLVIKNVKKAQEHKNGSAIGEQIFIMGHTPLFTCKNDKISIYDIDKKVHKFREIIYQLFDILTDNNIIYLCADTHNFSIMKITHNGKVLIQITAGTGGADPDLIIGKFNKEKIKNLSFDTIHEDILIKKDYDIQAYTVNSYGYVNINIDDDHIDVCYTQIIKAKREKKLLSLPHTSSIPIDIGRRKHKLTKITYKIENSASSLKYEKNEKGDFVNDPKYNSNTICEKIKHEKNGYITDEKGKLLCYKKLAKKNKKD